jgi:hypothetical protein
MNECHCTVCFRLLAQPSECSFLLEEFGSFGRVVHPAHPVRLSRAFSVSDQTSLDDPDAALILGPFFEVPNRLEATSAVKERGHDERASS